MHTRLSTGVSKGSLVLDYGQVLRDHVISPLLKQGADGVDQAVSNMGEYFLLREDMDGLLEVNQWPGNPDPLSNVDSKTKAAFTRKCNKKRAPLPYSVSSSVCKKRTRVGEEEDIEEEEENDDVENDASIRIKKPKTTARDD